MGSQRYTQQDLMNFDWDDGPLIEAYDKAKAKAAVQMKKLAKGQSSKKHSSSEDKQWTVGSYCRALYPEDGYYYEAKVLELGDDGKCTVEFLGYDDPEEVDVENLKRSKGKKARKSQIKSIEEDTSRMSLTCGETSDAESVSVASTAAKERGHRTRVAEDMMPPDFAAFLKNKGPRLSTFPPRPIFNYGQPFMPGPPPLPLITQCPPNFPDNLVMGSLLRSWYMAGYYSGLLEQTRIRNSCSVPCCCGHSNQCCQH